MSGTKFQTNTFTSTSSTAQGYKAADDVKISQAKLASVFPRSEALKLGKGGVNTPE